MGAGETVGQEIRSNVGEEMKRREEGNVEVTGRRKEVRRGREEEEGGRSRNVNKREKHDEKTPAVQRLT